MGSRVALGEHPQLIARDAATSSHVTEQEETTYIRDENVNAKEDDSDLPSNLDSSESELDVIPEEDDSELDEELRAFRTERRKKIHQKKKKKVPVPTPEVELGEAGADKGFDDIIRLNKRDKYAGRLGGDEECYSSSDIGSDTSRDELDVLAQRGIDLPARRKSRKLRFDPNCQITIFELGMVFESVVQFRKTVQSYAVENKVQLELKPNEKHRIRVKCKSKILCKWEIYASIDKNSGDFIVKKYHPFHRCPTKNKNKLCTSVYIAHKFQDRIVSQPNIKLWEIQELVRDELGLYVGRTVCFRAKCRVMSQFMGDWNLEFSRLCDYADIIKKTNPGSSCWVRTDKDTIPGKNLFVYFYMCFDALKRGWLEGCKKIIGLDGCFLKGLCKGELLVAVGRSGNNQMFPIARAVVDQETKHSWTWFIEYLISDLELGNGVGLTIMSDCQKGLIPTIQELLPNAEHRRCARHIWSNWSINWKGEERRKQFWRCAKASYEVKLKDELAKPNEVGPRHKSIITMLEEIRHKIMNRHVDMRRFANTWITDVSPMASEGDTRFIVDQVRRTCTCRSWQLRGIPCPHVVCAFYHLDQEPENEIESWYRHEVFLKAYQYSIQPIPNMKMWPESNNPSIEPPEVKHMPGRPGRCRRKQKDEPRKKYGKLSKG
ncbi:hypothetical protein KY290_017374 [Solanum tuberosum]|uniref:SWIM-type domain-containing protein n=1 Tax=Solanum tuberosum TaxID=4113 RepID=A0ABQ7VD05_SOLTU|nr:hypothetical protein KY290_017374 [Solanum tuberosum]